MNELNTIQKKGRLNKIYTNGNYGPGGACHHYKIFHDNKITKSVHDTDKVGDIQFQEGTRGFIDSTNGVTMSDLLEIVRHQLQCFQQGDFSCKENAVALTHIEEALMWLNKRVEDRIEREVLGQHKK